jgi:hypothetical protein
MLRRWMRVRMRRWILDYARGVIGLGSFVCLGRFFRGDEDRDGI